MWRGDDAVTEHPEDAWKPVAQPSKKTRLPGRLTGNALITGIICVLLSGTISFFVARWQAQDINKQASAAQQVTAILQLERDAGTFTQEASQLIHNRLQCDAQATPSASCKQARSIPVYDDPMISLQLALSADIANISDTIARNDAYKLEDDAVNAYVNISGPGFGALVDMPSAYAALINRC